MTNTTDQRLREIQERVEKATPGPWIYNSFNSIEAGEKIVAEILDHPQDDGPFKPEQTEERSAWYQESTRNADFIAESREDVPWLLEQIAALTREKAESVVTEAQVDAAVVALREPGDISAPTKLDQHRRQVRAALEAALSAGHA